MSYKKMSFNNSYSLEIRRKVCQAISVFWLASIVWIFSDNGIFYLKEPFRIFWTEIFIILKFSIIQGIKFGLLKPKWSEIEKNYFRRNNHEHTLKCLLEPDLIIIGLVPFVDPKILYYGVLLVLIDVFACIIGLKFGKHRIDENKSYEGSLGAFFLTFIIMWLITDIPYLLLITMCLIGVLIEIFSPKIGIKDNFLLALGGILFLLIIFNFTVKPHLIIPLKY
ncbi:MAG: hypothetical protein ACTSQJ_03600 [Promethearchaeota archaeon]